jgi:hypothetical protein
MLKMGFDRPPTILEVRGHAVLIGVKRTGKVQNPEASRMCFSRSDRSSD